MFVWLTSGHFVLGLNRAILSINTFWLIHLYSEDYLLLHTHIHTSLKHTVPKFHYISYPIQTLYLNIYYTIALLN